MTMYGWASALSPAVTVTGASAGPPAAPAEALHPVERFSGRLPGHGPLPPGQVRLRLTATDAVGATGRVRTLALTVLR